MGVEVTSISWLGQLTVGVQITVWGEVYDEVYEVNDVIARQNDPIYKLLPTSVI